eukprot:958348_1
MVKCWYLLGKGDAQELQNPREPNQTSADSQDIYKISWTSLSKLQIQYWNLEVENYRKFNTFALIKRRQNLDKEYEISLNSAEYDFAQHMHETDEARFILNGELYYDIYDDEQHIIRMHLTPGDLIIIPKYRLHRTILPHNIESVTFLQLTQATQEEEESKDNEDNTPLVERIKTYFFKRYSTESKVIYSINDAIIETSDFEFKSDNTELCERYWLCNGWTS